MHGAALTRLLDATFQGEAAIEILGGSLDRRPMAVTAIQMSGRDTNVTLVCTGPRRELH